MDSFLRNATLFGFFLLLLSCVGFAYDAGRGVTPFTVESLKNPLCPLTYIAFIFGASLAIFFGCLGLYEAWENGINRRVDEKLEHCREGMRSEIQDQYEKTLRKKKED